VFADEMLRCCFHQATYWCSVSTAIHVDDSIVGHIAKAPLFLVFLFWALTHNFLLIVLIPRLTLLIKLLTMTNSLALKSNK